VLTSRETAPAVDAPTVAKPRQEARDQQRTVQNIPSLGHPRDRLDAQRVECEETSRDPRDGDAPEQSPCECKDAAGRERVQHDVRQVKSARLGCVEAVRDPPQRVIERIREPRQRLVRACMVRREAPRDILTPQAAEMRVFEQELRVVPVDEHRVERRRERDEHHRDEQRTGEDRAA
jgi:hypothetical protein